MSTDGRKLLCSAFLCWEHRPPCSPSWWPVQRSLWHPDGVIEKAESLGHRTWGTVPSVLPEPRAGFCVWTLNRPVHIQHYTHADPADPVFPVCFFSLRTQLLLNPSFLLRVLWFVLLLLFPWKALHVSLCNTALPCPARVWKRISQHQFCHVIPWFGCCPDCFILLYTSDWNNVMQWAICSNTEMSRTIMFPMSEHISVIFTVNIPKGSMTYWKYSLESPQSFIPKTFWNLCDESLELFQ